MRTLIINRDLQDENVTHGRLRVVEAGRTIFECCTLELPWRDNHVQISCIPKGEYRLLHRSSPRFANHLHIIDVPGRSYILIHPANFVHQLRGCIAVGENRMHLDGDQILDITNSRRTMERLLKLVQNRDKLIIQ
ncbi:DUF5675 family protein [uncultured Algoriphagus sp.]|uniref:DUF5675 family protein n=1 Tax=uncultured Algoriphagus sp. TaxID=417365 RepID=UPI00258B8E1C|nr:DUF5675 family protein [uncultured Algoriphagus sp.]